MKIYKNLVNSVALTLQEIFIKNRFADKALEKTFKQNIQWGSRDRRFVAEAVYDITRNFRLYSYLAETNNNFWFITAVWLVIKNNQIPDWQEFKHVNPNVILAKKESLKTNLPIYESYPDWLWDFCSSELGKAEWETEAIAMNHQAPVFLRANTLKTTRDKLAESLKKDGIETLFVKGAIDALELVKRENIFQNKAFKEGWFELQDAGSQLISEFIEPKSNELVIDACAGAGGKSLHLAALMKNKGKVISLDVEEFKLKELKRRALRAGAFNIETRLIEEGKTIADLTNKADRLLLDVPCSGLGVLKRNLYNGKRFYFIFTTVYPLRPLCYPPSNQVLHRHLPKHSTLLRLSCSTRWFWNARATHRTAKSPAIWPCNWQKNWAQTRVPLRKH
jgi:16S rRNA (cytosine967-C5)-methyltransferase